MGPQKAYKLKVDDDVAPIAPILGWVAVSISTGIAGLWALWGSIENFHEGWFSTSLELNLRRCWRTF